MTFIAKFTAVGRAVRHSRIYTKQKASAGLVYDVLTFKYQTTLFGVD